MPVPERYEFFIDPSRCIGCNACVQACTECDTHRGQSMIQLDYVDLRASPQTVPVVCMHCDSPTCAEVCPADAIKRTEDGVVQTARKPRCIACNNCVLACPFGVPKMDTGASLMMKCDLCYDRTSEGLQPMCASVCPSGALYFGTREEIERLRPRSRPVNDFRFGAQTISTKVNMMVPRDGFDLIAVAEGLARTEELARTQGPGRIERPGRIEGPGRMEGPGRTEGLDPVERPGRPERDREAREDVVETNMFEGDLDSPLFRPDRQEGP